MSVSELGWLELRNGSGANDKFPLKINTFKHEFDQLVTKLKTLNNKNMKIKCSKKESIE